MIETLLSGSIQRKRVQSFDWRNLDEFTELRILFDRQINCLETPIELPIGSDKMALKLLNQSDERGSLIGAEVWVGNHVFDLTFESVLLQRVIDSMGFSQDVSSLNDVGLPLICEHFLALIATELETLFDGDIKVLDADAFSRPILNEDLNFQLENAEGDTFIFGISGSPASLELLLELVPDVVRENKTSGLIKGFNHTLSYRVPSFSMDTVDLQDMVEGDGFLLPDDWDNEKLCEVVVNDCICVPVEKVHDNIIISGPIKNLNSSDEQEWLDMSYEKGVSVEISVEVANGQFSIDELNALSEGAILPFPTAIGNEVNLISNGIKLAHGELVKIDGKFGVRITKIP